MLSCYLGIGAVYVVFVSGIVQECVDMEKTINQAYYALIIFPLLLLMNLVKGMNRFASISIIANGLLVVSAIIGTVYAIKEGNGKWVLIEEDVTSYPKFIGTAFFSMCSPGLVNHMKLSMIFRKDITINEHREFHSNFTTSNGKIVENFEEL